MDAVLLSLLVTLPIIAVCVIAWQWVRRSATPSSAQRKKNALYLILVLPAALYMLHGLLIHTQIYRSILGISTVVLINNSGSQLNHVKIVMHAPNHHYTYQFNYLRSQESERFALRAPELEVDRIAFSLGTQSVASTNIARVKRGQVLTVRVNPSGKIANETD